MKIAFDGRPAQRPPHSFRRVLNLMLKAAAHMGWDHEIWTSGPLHPECAGLQTRCRPFPPRSGDIDFLWSATPSVYALPGLRSIALVCDVNPLLPDGRNPLSRWRRAHRFRRRVGAVFATSWRVATDSQDARERLARAFPQHGWKLGVTPLFADPSLQRVPGKRCEAELAEMGLRPGYLFFVGSFRRHKNWRGLIRAYAGLPPRLRRQHPLVLAGAVHRDSGRAARLLRKLDLTGDVLILGETPEARMAALYSGAVLFVFPSFMEGFGLPALEAMQCGLPVIATNRTAVPEVLGDAARYVDPADLPALRRAMAELLEDEPARADLRRRGAARAAQFGPGRMGRAMLALMREQVDCPV